MWQNAHDTYLESRVLSADPVELVRMLYQGAMAAVRDARRHLAAGEILERSRAISKAAGILMELTGSLDHSGGGEISRNLARLYDYMIRKLVEANLQQTDEPLAESLGLLATLAEAWEGVGTAEPQPVSVERESPWGQAMFGDSAASGQQSHAWSL
jgi:flagellar protein FliS